MKIAVMSAWAVVAFCGVASGASMAHHSFSATYDGERAVTLEGAVTRIEWVNPHAYIFIDVADSLGTIRNWALEIGNPLDLERNGWSRDTLDVGEVIRVEGAPARAPGARAYAASIVREADGERLFLIPESAPPSANNPPAPRWPDGQVRLGPAPGEKGYWGRATAVALVEDGADVAMNADGLLENLSDVDRVAPFRPWAKALYELRQRNLLRDDPATRCLPPGGPRQFHTPHGMQFIEQRELGRILVLLGGGNRNWRVIYTDGRPQAPAEELVLTFYGHSVGTWEGDTLVVDSVGFNERFWMTSGGLPHTEALHLIERISRPDLNTLRYEVTVDDPRAYTRPWTGSWTISWVPGEEIEEHFCEENAESTFIR